MFRVLVAAVMGGGCDGASFRLRCKGGFTNSVECNGLLFCGFKTRSLWESFFAFPLRGCVMSRCTTTNCKNKAETKSDRYRPKETKLSSLPPVEHSATPTNATTTNSIRVLFRFTVYLVLPFTYVNELNPALQFEYCFKP